MMDDEEGAFLKAKKFDTNLFFQKKSFTKRNSIIELYSL